ncbi:MAG: nuclear transport factor 2 family protein, partial [Gammaproteobacteria bacterium]
AQDIVDVAPDRKSAQGRFRCFMLGGVHENKTDAPPAIPSQFWEGGIYENIFVKEVGIWKIRIFNYSLIWQAGYDDGWAHSRPGTLMVSRFTKTWPEDTNGPDEIVTKNPRTWPDMYVVPFHYPHPVTGKSFK